MKAPLALAIVLLLGLGCERNRASTCVTGASSPCTCPTGVAGAQVCQDDGTFGVCQCTPAPVVAPVAVVTPDVPVPVAAPMAAPMAPPVAMPTAPHAPHAPTAAPTAPMLGLPGFALPGVVMPNAPAPGTAAPTANNTAPSGSNAPTVQQLGQIGQLVSQGLNPQQIQSITNAITGANRSAAPDHPTFSPTELTRLSQMATQENAGPSALQSAAQSMLGGN